MDALPELLFSEAAAAAQSKRVRRLAEAGRLKKLYAGVYTSVVDAPLESVVLRNWRAITSHLLPQGVISHRSAFAGSPQDGRLVITRGSKRRTIALPGLAIDVFPGPGPSEGGPQADYPYGDLYLSGEPRRFLENLTRGRGWAARALPQPEIEAQLEKILALRGEHRLNDLRDASKAVADRLGWAAEFKRLDHLIGALLGTHTAGKLSAKQAMARAAGRPYDTDRLQLFDVLFGALNREVFATVDDPAPTGIARENFAFFEAYFSNFIEGTTFTVGEAERIVFEGQIIENRSADSHDILGTFAAATRSPWRDQPPSDAEAFLRWLKAINAQVMQQRPEKLPGQWKDQTNQAGSTVFVFPELVPGTLREGFERIQALAEPVARALMMMFVVAEVHPFVDGNGRTARLAMNAVLSAAKQSRIIVPTVYREDYLLPLKALSHNAEPKPLILMMTRIQAWSAGFDYGQPRELVREQLAVHNAFQEDLRNYRLIYPEKTAAA